MIGETYTIDISHSQIAVFDTKLDRPFNFWTDGHVNQGFAWRPGSVSFGTLREGGPHTIRIVVAKALCLSPDAIRVIRVPFDVPIEDEIEIASISDGFRFHLESGRYVVQFECFLDVDAKGCDIQLTFERSDEPAFEIVRADPEISVTTDLLLTASPA